MADKRQRVKNLPPSRIRCTNGKIIVGNREFLSASDALLAYLQQFDGKSRTKQQQDAYELLMARSGRANDLHRSRNIRSEIQDTLHEAKLRRLKRTMEDNQKKDHSALRKEVEDALTRSRNLLERVSDETSTVHCVSSIGSMTTEALLSVNPLDGSSRNAGIDEDGKHRHIYSYRMPRSRSRTVGSIPLKPQTPNKVAFTSRRSSIDSVIPPSVLKNASKRSTSSSSGAASRHSDPTDILKRLRSRSISPLPVHLQSDNYARGPVSYRPSPSWINELDTSSTSACPSWVNGLDVAGVNDSVWTRQSWMGGRPAPSWVHQADVSDITTDSHLHRDKNISQSHFVFAPATHEISANMTDSRPGLNFSDLATSGAIQSLEASSDLRTQAARLLSRDTQHDGIHGGTSSKENTLCVSNSHGFSVYSPQDMLESNTSQGHADFKNSFHKKLLSESSDFKTTLDKYLEQLDVGTPFSKEVSSSSQIGKMPRCSSMDTFSLMTGKAEAKSDISGASPISKGQNTSQVGIDVEHVLHPASPAKTTNTELVLDGDRSWEQGVKTFKSPVYVDETKEIGKALRSVHKTHSPTLTGSQQPGSMEALKNMLFKLQAEESSTGEKSGHVDRSLVTAPLDLPALKDYNFTSEPGGQSLERALVHLTRLKTLAHSGSQGPAADGSVSAISLSSCTPTSALSQH